MAELRDLSTSAASNTGRFPNGMQVDAVNDAARELEAMIGREFKDRTGQLVTSGTGHGYSIIPHATYTEPLGAGVVFMIRFHVANFFSATLTVQGCNPRSLSRQGGAVLSADDIAANQIVQVVFNPATDKFVCIGIGDPADQPAMPRVTKTTLPPVSDQRPVIVTDESGGAVMAFSDGSNWRRVTDRAIVS